MHRRQLLGAVGEQLAADHLAAHGYHILQRNWRPHGTGFHGEIDVVARHGATLAFCEVKTRRSRAAGSPLEAVGRDKRRRLRRLVGLYLQAHPHRGRVRGDVVTVDLTAVDTPGGAAVITHLRGVW